MAADQERIRPYRALGVDASRRRQNKLYPLHMGDANQSRVKL